VVLEVEALPNIGVLAGYTLKQKLPEKLPAMNKPILEYTSVKVLLTTPCGVLSWTCLMIKMAN